MHRRGLDGIAEKDVFIAWQEQRHRSKFFAAEMTAMVTALKAVEREEDAAIILQRLKDLVPSYKNEMDVWRYARLVSARRSMGDALWALRLPDVVLTSKADQGRKGPVRRSWVDLPVAPKATGARQMDQTPSEHVPDDGRNPRGDY